MHREPTRAWILAAVLVLAPVAWSEEPPGDPFARLARQAADRRRDVREQALESLGSLRDSRVGPLLRERFLHETDAGLREAAGFLVAQTDPLEYFRALRMLVKGGDTARVPFLINHAVLEDARYLRALDLWAASRLDGAATRRELVSYAGSRSRNVALRAAELIGIAGDGAAAPALVALLDHAERYVRIEALLALAKLRGAAVGGRIARVALTDTDAHVRRHAVWALRERGELVPMIGPLTDDPDATVRQRVAEALDEKRARGWLEEGPFQFRYRGDPGNVLALFRRAEMCRPVRLGDALPADIRAKLRRALGLLDQRAPKFAFFVRFALYEISASERHATGTFLHSKVFNIKPSTLRRWPYNHLAKALVHDATHAYLALMGEKTGEHRGEEEAFQEAFWADRQLAGRPERTYDDEVDRYLEKAHWVGDRKY